MEQTIAAVKEVHNNPLSIVIVGVGPGSFDDMRFLLDLAEDGHRLTFVDAKQHSESELSEATLKNIPGQLTAFFDSKGIAPHPVIESDEIIIEPFTEEDEIKTDVIIADNGEISLQTDAAPTAQTPDNKQSSVFKAFGEKGKSLVMSQAKRQFGRIKKTMERNINRSIDQKVNKMFGIPTGKKKPARRKR